MTASNTFMPTEPASSTAEAEAAENDDSIVVTECSWVDCCETFPSSDALGRHLDKVHIGKKQSSYICEWKGCLREREPLPNRFAITAHLRRHTGERPYHCQFCGKRFARSDALTKHAKAQHLEFSLIQKLESPQKKASTLMMDGLSNGTPSLIALKKHIQYLEREKSIMLSALQSNRCKIRRLRAEKLLFLETLLCSTTRYEATTASRQ